MKDIPIGSERDGRGRDHRIGGSREPLRQRAVLDLGELLLRGRSHGREESQGAIMAGKAI